MVLVLRSGKSKSKSTSKFLPNFQKERHVTIARELKSHISRYLGKDDNNLIPSHRHSIHRQECTTRQTGALMGSGGGSNDQAG